MDVHKSSAGQMNSLRRFFHTMNRFMVWMWKIGLVKTMNMWPAGMGRIMVIRHRGRRSGREYLTPVNYAIVGGEIYCTAGFGAISDWYRNILANPQVELWLPGGKRWYCAEDISAAPERMFLLPTGYEPPILPSNGGNTLYQYDLDRALTRITRPDGGILNFSYDSAGRLSTLSLPTGQGQLIYAYDATTGKLTGITAPDGGTLN